jgi:TatD DNase family protein
MVKYIDAHCHMPQNSELITVGAMYNAAQQSDWQAVVNIQNPQDDIFGAVGIHPWYVSQLDNMWYQELRQLLLNNPELMVGEIGLDKFHPNMEKQTSAFCQQLALAYELNRGVCLHCVGAWDKVLHVFKVFQNKLPRFIVAHCYSGNPKDIKMLSEKYNMYFSFGPRNLQNTSCLLSTSLDRILAETDGTNPNDVVTVVWRIASILNIAPEKMADIIYKNTIRMLNK